MVHGVEGHVVVVGGGPVGLLLACELAGRGVRTVVVESRAGVSRCPRATTLHARAVQCLVRRGYLAGLVSGSGGRMAGRESGAGGADTGGGPVSSPFHFAGLAGLVISVPAGEPEPVLKCAQEVLERHFEERARAVGVRVLRGCRVTDVRQGPGGVRVTARGPGGTVVCTGRYLVGADGARSVVRREAGLASRTYRATVSAMAGDVRVEGDRGSLEAGWRRTERGWIVAKPLEEGWVRLRTLNCAGAHADRDRPLVLEELRREVCWITGRDVVLGEGRWLSRFSDFSRLVASYRQGRIFLAGDAAHVHFPVGGQGLSTGVLDAVNLGWKLALAVRGWAGEGLLDSYDSERRPAAQRVIDHTRAQLALMRPGPELDPLRALFGELLARGGESGVLASMVSAQDTVLPTRGAGSSAWEGTFLHNTVLHTRQGRADVIGLLREGLPLLLLLGGHRGTDACAEKAEGWAGRVWVVEAEPVSGLPCALLVRPDGYVAWALEGEGPAAWVSGAGGLAAVLTELFGPAAAVRAPGVLAGAVG
ncbi:FAD-dependent monooxygenase [Streptomyces sp. NPDC094149]|uniref:FAD-dependent monooxygenase n=1 Tax=Streptomyces sp. NPDC094149 TaxID=3155079 RepID=UPI0033267E58